MGLIDIKLYPKAQMLIEKGADVNIPNKHNNTPLIISDDLQTTKMLLEKGANINHANHFGETALMWAVSKENLEKVKMLLEAGADINLLTNNGSTAMDYAKLNRNKEIIALLEKATKKDKKFIPTVYKVDLGKNCTFEGSFVDELPDTGFINTPDGGKFPVKYVDGDFVFTSPYLSTVNIDGKYIFNI
jgi:hypothetical protein